TGRKAEGPDEVERGGTGGGARINQWHRARSRTRGVADSEGSVERRRAGTDKIGGRGEAAAGARAGAVRAGCGRGGGCGGAEKGADRSRCAGTGEWCAAVRGFAEQTGRRFGGEAGCGSGGRSLGDRAASGGVHAGRMER